MIEDINIYQIAGVDIVIIADARMPEEFEEFYHSESVFRARASLFLNENGVPDNFRVLTF